MSSAPFIYDHIVLAFVLHYITVILATKEEHRGPLFNISLLATYRKPHYRVLGMNYKNPHGLFELLFYFPLLKFYQIKDSVYNQCFYTFQ